MGVGNIGILFLQIIIVSGQSIAQCRVHIEFLRQTHQRVHAFFAQRLIAAQKRHDQVIIRPKILLDQMVQFLRRKIQKP